MSRIRVRVKFCGHCNPLFEGAALIEKAAAIDTDLDFVSWDDPDKDALVIVSCCPVSCVDRPAFGGVVVNVAGHRVNGRLLPEEGMAAALVTAIRDMLRTAGGEQG